MGDIGYIALLVSLLAGLCAAAMALWGKARKDGGSLLAGGRYALWAATALITVSVLALWYLLLTNDFRYQYVYETTSTFQPLVYHISALWQGQAGSLLFWLWGLSLLAALLALVRPPAQHAEMPYAMALLGVLEAFFALLLLAAVNPFEPARQVYLEGFGGNPLLENPGMIYHPPTVLLGYAATAIPYALAMGGLLTGRFSDRDWVHRLRSWAILSWLLLSIGILLGAQWAYVELGWGGYWGWDPVENASLIPWLVNTALLHTLMAQERRGIMKLWNAILVAATFLLCIFATWLTRGGALNSVHTFGASAVSDLLLLGLFAFTGLSVLLISARRPVLRREAEIQAMSAREGSLLYTAIFFVVAAALVFIGTMFPSLSQAFLGQQIAWRTESYGRITRILAPILLVLLGVCPLLSWGRTDVRRLWQNLMLPCALALVVALTTVLFAGITYAALAFALVAFVAAATLSEVYRGWRARVSRGENWLTAASRLFGQNRRRYGGYLVHLGVLLMVIGVTGQSLYQSSRLVALQQGESVTVGPYRLEYIGSGTEDTEASRRFYADLQVYRSGRPVFTLQPEKNFHWNVQQWVTEVAIHANLAEDLYVILSGLEDDGLATFEVLINPLMSWLWIGGAALIVGALAALWPKRLAAVSPVTQGVPQRIDDDIERRVRALREKRSRQKVTQNSRGNP